MQLSEQEIQLLKQLRSVQGFEIVIKLAKIYRDDGVRRTVNKTLPHDIYRAQGVVASMNDLLDKLTRLDFTNKPIEEDEDGRRDNDRYGYDPRRDSGSRSE